LESSGESYIFFCYDNIAAAMLSSLMQKILAKTPRISIPVAVTCAALGWYFLSTRIGRREEELDEDSEFPMVRNGMSGLEFARNALGKEGPSFLLDLAREMGTFIFRTPGSTSGAKHKVYVVGDPPAARTILENSKNSKSVPWYKPFDDISTGVSFFAHNGKRAMHVRKSTAPAFSGQNVKRMSDIVETIMEKWVTERLEPLYVKPITPIDVDREMVTLTTDILFQVGFGYKLSAGVKDLFVGCMECAMQEFALKLNIWKNIKLTAWMFSGIRKGRRAANEMVKLCTKVLEAYRKNPSPDPNTLIHMLANDPNYDSDEERTRDMVMFAFGGFATSAHAIAWTLLELARNPEEHDQLRSALSNFSSKEEARQCQELKNVIKEILRLQTPSALGVVRTMEKDVRLPGNKVITAGSICITPFYLIQRNGNYFDNPDSFVPSRWNDLSEESLKAFMPFALGGRSCPGQALAYEILTIILSRLLTRYEFSVAEEGRSDNWVTFKTIGTKLWIKEASK
jgi:cytochrome P450